MKDKSPELVAAYKILAFLKCYYSLYEFIAPLDKAMKKHDERLNNWWNANAKKVIPYSDLYIHNSGKRILASDWKKVVTQAAAVWADVAQNWAVIIMPDFMGSSEEYQSIQEYYKKLHEEEEYKRYLQLKEKFEGKR